MLQDFLFAAMLAWREPSLAEVPYYQEIARDVANVALDETEAPVFDGDHAREKTALLLLAIARYESGGFARAVDVGQKLGDGGKSHCLMQVQLRPGEAIPTREACVRLGLARVRESMALCRSSAPGDRLGGYVRGRCIAGDPAARIRWNLARDWWAAHKGEL